MAAVTRNGVDMDAKALAASLTTTEKAALLAGASHWKTNAIDARGVTSVVLSDGPHGLRKQENGADHLGIHASDPATCFPTASALACSFDESLLEDVGAAIGEEARDQKIDVVLGPGVNMKRSPLCGRNFEYFSEDPLLSGALGAAMVRGIQSRGVGACVKHFAGNNQEHARMVADSVIDDRALREIYLAPFERVVREAQPWAVMTGYNRLNGTYCSQNAWLLRDVLRGEWGFRGAVISDWGAMSESVASVEAGLDLCMPGPRPDHAEVLARAVEAGELPDEALDEAASNILALEQRAHEGRTLLYACDYSRHARVAYRAACESAVLLENNGVLPLAPSATVAVVGAFALLPRYQGAGSSKIEPVHLDDPWSAFLDAGVDVRYAPGYDAASGDSSPELLEQAAAVAAKSDVAVVFAGLPDRFESEGFDRKLMVMPKGHVKLIERVCAANPNTVVVLQGGSPMEMPWRDKPAAILLMYLSGCRGGHAAVDLLLGRANPCGKLAETWPARLQDTALGLGFPDTDREVLYRESLFVGYRYFDAAGVEPPYPFGFGRSYTSFAYDDARVALDADGIEVSCVVANTGARAGAEIVQLYVEAPERAAFGEVRRLAAFAKAKLAPGESTRVRMRLDERAFRYWDTTADAWRIDAGRYKLALCASSRDERLACEVRLVAGEGPFTVQDARTEPESFALAPYAAPTPGGFTDEAFTALYGRPLPPRRPIRPFTPDSPVSDLSVTFLGRQAFRIADIVMAKASERMSDDMKAMMDEIASDTPLRSLSSAEVPFSVVEGLVALLNGHYAEGIGKLGQQYHLSENKFLRSR